MASLATAARKGSSQNPAGISGKGEGAYTANGNLSPSSSARLTKAEIQLAERKVPPRISKALESTARIGEEVEDKRLRQQVHFATPVPSGAARFTRVMGDIMGGTRHQENSEAQKLDGEISKCLSELRMIFERLVMPSLADLRDAFRGKTFQRTADTPRALLLISVPTEKVKTLVTFDSLRQTVSDTFQRSSIAESRELEDGRIVMNRAKFNGVEQILEFAYRRPGKVDVYLNGERQGSMWTDDAVKAASAFAAGREIPFQKVKAKRYSEYTVL